MYAEPDLLHITVTDHGDRTLVTLQGELDLASQGGFRARVGDLLHSGRVDLVIDLTELTFLDSTGLGALIGVRRRAYASQGSLILVCPTHAVMQLFSIAGLERVFDIRPSRDGLLDPA